MNPTLATLTDQTCGEACWHAAEDICQCSCGGKNHACLRGKDGDQPVRSRRIQGIAYTMAAVESYATYLGSCRATSMRPLETMHRVGRTVLRAASASEVARWPELAAWRVHEHCYGGPLVLWTPID